MWLSSTALHPFQPPATYFIDESLLDSSMKIFLYESETCWKVAGMYIPLTLLRKPSFHVFKSWFIPLSSDFGSPISLLSERQAI